MWHKQEDQANKYQQMELDKCNKNKEGQRKLFESWWRTSGVCNTPNL